MKETQNLRLETGQDCYPFRLDMDTRADGAQVALLALNIKDLLPELPNPAIQIVLSNYPALGTVEFNPYNPKKGYRNPFPLGIKDVKGGGLVRKPLRFDFSWVDLLPEEIISETIDNSKASALREDIRNRLMRLKLNLYFPTAEFKNYQAGFFDEDLRSSFGFGFHDLLYVGEFSSYVNSQIDEKSRLALTIPKSKLKEVRANFSISDPKPSILTKDPFREAFPSLF